MDRVMRSPAAFFLECIAVGLAAGLLVGILTR